MQLELSVLHGHVGGVLNAVEEQPYRGRAAVCLDGADCRGTAVARRGIERISRLKVDECNINVIPAVLCPKSNLVLNEDSCAVAAFQDDLSLCVYHDDLVVRGVNRAHAAVGHAKLARGGRPAIEERFMGHVAEVFMGFNAKVTIKLPLNITRLEQHGARGRYEVRLVNDLVLVLLDLLAHLGVAVHNAVNIFVDEPFGKDGASP